MNVCMRYDDRQRVGCESQFGSLVLLFNVTLCSVVAYSSIIVIVVVVGDGDDRTKTKLLYVPTDYC